MVWLKRYGFHLEVGWIRRGGEGLKKPERDGLESRISRHSLGEYSEKKRPKSGGGREEAVSEADTPKDTLGTHENAEKTLAGYR